MKIATAQLEALDAVIVALSKKPSNSKVVKQLTLLSEKLHKSNAPKKETPGIGVAKAIEAMKEVLGSKLAVPKNPSTQWTIYLAKRIRDLGLTVEDCKSIARAISNKWDPPYGFEYCIKAADRLLAESTTTQKQGKVKLSTPVEMEEWE